MIPTPLSPLPVDLWPAELSDLADTFLGQANVYRTMAHHPALVRAWVDLRQHVVLDTSLGRDASEVVILRAAVALDSAYEWGHHVVRARALGFSDARIAALKGAPADMIEPDATLAAAVDEVTAHARLSAPTLQALGDLVGAQGVLDLFATVGFYSTLAFIVNSFATPLDASISAALSAQPLEAPAP